MAVAASGGGAGRRTVAAEGRCRVPEMVGGGGGRTACQARPRCPQERRWSRLAWSLPSVFITKISDSDRLEHWSQSRSSSRRDRRRSSFHRWSGSSVAAVGIHDEEVCHRAGRERDLRARSGRPGGRPIEMPEFAWSGSSGCCRLAFTPKIVESPVIAERTRSSSHPATRLACRRSRCSSPASDFSPVAICGSPVGWASRARRQSGTTRSVRTDVVAHFQRGRLSIRRRSFMPSDRDCGCNWLSLDQVEIAIPPGSRHVSPRDSCDSAVHLGLLAPAIFPSADDESIGVARLDTWAALLPGLWRSESPERKRRAPTLLTARVSPGSSSSVRSAFPMLQL